MIVSVLGAGSWGTALGVHLHELGHAVTLWEFYPKLAASLLEKRENEKMLPGVFIPEAVRITNDIAEALDGTEMVLFVVPTTAVRSTARLASPHFDVRSQVVNAAKGIEKGTGARISTILTEELSGDLDGRTVTFSGPSHAEEVSRKIPTAIVAACPEIERAEMVQQVFSSETLRVYTNVDQVGVELAGSLKNVIAVAAGVLDGLGFGDNTKGALLTRGLAEMSRLGTALGADPLTFSGLSGMGDLITTCISHHSRNRHVGEQIGLGRSLEEILADMVMVAEGVNTIQSAWELAEKTGVDMPITRSMHEVLYEGKNVRQAVQELMTRDLKPELEHHRG